MSQTRRSVVSPVRAGLPAAESSDFNMHPDSSVGGKRRPTKRQVRAQARKSSRNQLNWRHAMDSNRYTFPVHTRRVA